MRDIFTSIDSSFSAWPTSAKVVCFVLFLLAVYAELRHR